MRSTSNFHVLFEMFYYLYLINLNIHWILLQICSYLSLKHDEFTLGFKISKEHYIMTCHGNRDLGCVYA